MKTVKGSSYTTHTVVYVVEKMIFTMMKDGSVYCGGQPTSNDKQCTEYGKHIQDNLFSMIAMRQL